MKTRNWNLRSLRCGVGRIENGRFQAPSKTRQQILTVGFIHLCQAGAVIVFMLAAVCLDAAVLTVTTLADSGPGSLRQQVTLSSPGDTIQFAVTGTILFSSSITVPYALNIQGPGPAALTVDAGGHDRAFIISGGPVIISGMTISNGVVMGANGSDGPIFHDGQDGIIAYGGAILVNGTTDYLILSNCWVTGNAVVGGHGGRGGNDYPSSLVKPPGNGGNGGNAAGGAVYIFSGGLMFNYNCNFSGNRAVGGPGGDGGDSEDSAGTGGAGGYGGAGYEGAIYATYVTNINCTFSGNRAIGGQGGNGGTNFSSGTGGTGGTGGGGGPAESGALNGYLVVCTNSTFSGNTVTPGTGGQGGAALLGAGGNGGNGGNGDAGAAYMSYSTIYSCTIVSNSAVAGAGGAPGTGTPPGAFGAPGTGTAGGIEGYTIACANPIGNTILADNFASTVFSNYYVAFEEMGYNFIGSDDYPACGWSSTTQVGIASPIHPQLGPLAQNGGGLPTHAPVFGGSPLIVSPVIDAGTNFGFSTDERGAPRPYSFGLPRPPGGDGSDIGAFELGSSDLGLGMDTNNNLILSWPAYYGDLTLQFATSLPGTSNWSVVPDTPVVVGSQFVVTNRMTNAMQFYRLMSR